MWSYWKLHKYPILIFIGSIVCYTSFAYDLQRTDFVKLITLCAALFIFLIKLIQFEKWNFKLLLAAGILFRLVFLFAEPNLSQDFYRFIWDGELIKNGISPYLYTPNSLIESGKTGIANAQELHEGMGELSARNFSNYPPLNQIFFALAAILGGGTILGNVIIMRLFIIMADIGTLYFGRKLLLKLNKSNHLLFWYFLNPLVIIELTGNLHFEGIMIFFFVWAAYLATINKWKWAAPLYAFSILTKLIPLLFLPIFLKFLGVKKSLLFYLLVASICLAILLPFYSDSFIGHYSQTVGLWFSNFEFNAGLYNVVKKIAVTYYEAKPWVLIKVYGAYIPKATILIALLVTLIRKNQRLNIMIGSMLFMLTSYYFLATTVHPWYIVFVLLLGVLADYKFAIVWSAMVFLSYFAYSNLAFNENLWLLAIEYIIVFSYLGYEIFKKQNLKLLFQKNLNAK